MKSQKTRAIGGWTLFAVIVSVIFFTILKDKYPETLEPLAIYAYALMGIAGVFCVIQLIRAEGQEKKEKGQLENN